MARKDKRVCIRTTKRRMGILKAYTEKVEKSITQIIEDFIDSLEEEVEVKKKDK